MLGEKVVCATVSPHLYTLSDTPVCHSGSCTLSSGIYSGWEQNSYGTFSSFFCCCCCCCLFFTSNCCGLDYFISMGFHALYLPRISQGTWDGFIMKTENVVLNSKLKWRECWREWWFHEEVVLFFVSSCLIFVLAYFVLCLCCWINLLSCHLVVIWVAVFIDFFHETGLH